MLCPYSCHRACSLGRKEEVTVTAWQRRCACPGREHERASHGDPIESLPGYEEWGETFESEMRRRSQPRKEAFDAARSAASGKTREEIEDLYVAELGARGVEIPPGQLLSADVDFLSGDARAGLGKVWKYLWREVLRV